MRMLLSHTGCHARAPRPIHTPSVHQHHQRAQVSLVTGGGPVGTEAVDYLFFVPFLLILGALGAGARSILLGDDGLYSQVTGDPDPDSIKSKIRRARSTSAGAFSIRLPELPFVDVYDQPPREEADVTPDPPGYTAYRKQFEQKVAGVQLPGAAMQPPARPEQEERLRRQLASAVAAENYSRAASVKRELDALLLTPSRVLQLESELADAVAREDYTAAARLKRELIEAELPEA